MIGKNDRHISDKIEMSAMLYSANLVLDRGYQDMGLIEVIYPEVLLIHCGLFVWVVRFLLDVMPYFLQYYTYKIFYSNYKFSRTHYIFPLCLISFFRITHIFYPIFACYYLSILWLVLCDSGLVWKPLIWTICTKIEWSIWVIGWQDITF